MKNSVILLPRQKSAGNSKYNPLSLVYTKAAHYDKYVNERV